MKRSSPALCAVLLLLSSPGPGAGQILLRWPVRATPWPEALLTGGAAALWNPAGISAGVDGHGEMWIAHVDGPDATGLRGLAMSVTGNLPWIGRVAAAYQHLGIGDIPRTDESPSADGALLDVGDDAVAVSLARRVPPGAAVGLAVRYLRAGYRDRVADRVAVDAGVILRAELALPSRFAILLRDFPAEPAWRAGVEMTTPERVPRPWSARIAYGIADRFEGDAVEHRFATGVTWRRRLHVEAGLSHTTEDGSWVGLWMLGADFGRYSVAVLWEELPNDFGPALHYRFAIELP
ncbi:MAG: hypothetical protein HY704_10995 [Gemmatimonadetes bacterium]|nr:hypothetical protein [Gemmatimonadota bacterium]